MSNLCPFNFTSKGKRLFHSTLVGRAVNLASGILNQKPASTTLYVSCQKKPSTTYMSVYYLHLNGVNIGRGNGSSYVSAAATVYVLHCNQLAFWMPFIALKHALFFLLSTCHPSYQISLPYEAI